MILHLVVRGNSDHVTGHRHASVARDFWKADGRGLGGANLALFCFSFDMLCGFDMRIANMSLGR